MVHLLFSHYYLKHVLIDNPAPELLIALGILAVPVLLILFGKVVIVDTK